MVFKISCLMERHPMKGGSEMPFDGTKKHRLEQWSNTTQFLRKTNLDCISSARKSCQVNFSVMHYTRAWIWKGDIMVADIEELEEMDASGTPRQKAQRKWKFFNAAKKWKHSYSLQQVEQVNISGGAQRLRPSTSIQDRPERGEEPEILRADSLLQTFYKMTQHGTMRKLKKISGLSQEISFVATTWNPESNCTCREEESFPIPLKYMDVTRTTHTSLDVWLENILKIIGT